MNWLYKACGFLDNPIDVILSVDGVVKAVLEEGKQWFRYVKKPEGYVFSDVASKSVDHTALAGGPEGINVVESAGVFMIQDGNVQVLPKKNNSTGKPPQPEDFSAIPNMFGQSFV